MDGIYVMVANKRSAFSFTLHHVPSPCHFLLYVSRFVSKQNPCVWVQLSVFWSDQNHECASMTVWVEKMCWGWSPFESPKRCFFVHAYVRACECCCTDGFISIEKCILLSWPSNLVILRIKVIKVPIERIPKWMCVCVCVSIFFTPWMDDNSHKLFAVWC